MAQFGKLDGDKDGYSVACRSFFVHKKLFPKRKAIAENSFALKKL